MCRGITGVERAYGGAYWAGCVCGSIGRYEASEAERAWVAGEAGRASEYDGCERGVRVLEPGVWARGSSASASRARGMCGDDELDGRREPD